MSHHTINQIAQQHHSMQIQGFQNRKIKCREKDFNYYIMSTDMGTTFLDFTHCIVAFERTQDNPQIGALFGLSDAIPEDFREPAMQFEILHLWFNLPALEAAGEEVALLKASCLSDQRQNMYIQWRHKFFLRLAIQADALDVSEEKCAEYQALHNYFSSLLEM